jgi:hypothetical protein
MREDHESRVPGREYQGITARPVYRHLARVSGLAAGRRTRYQVVSVDDSGAEVTSEVYSLAPEPTADCGVQLLLTSDHQLGPAAAATLTRIGQTVGVRLDGILLAGDMINTADRASDWFDEAGGAAFFATMTGRGAQESGGRLWPGAPLLQHTPLYPTLGNHEVMGDRPDLDTLVGQRDQVLPGKWDATTYQELFPAPAAHGGYRPGAYRGAGSGDWKGHLGNLCVSRRIRLCTT